MWTMTKDLVLIEEEPNPEQYHGLTIPGEYALLSHRGRVLACGPGYVDADGVEHPVDLEPGMEVLFTPWEHEQHRLGERRVVITRVVNVVLVLQGYGPGGVRWPGQAGAEPRAHSSCTGRCTRSYPLGADRRWEEPAPGSQRPAPTSARPGGPPSKRGPRVLRITQGQSGCPGGPAGRG